MKNWKARFYGSKASPESECEFWVHKALNNIAKSAIGKPLKAKDKTIGKIINASWS